jgi:predicted nucleic acid-binding protein
VILVDTSVLVDFFRGGATPAARRLELLDAEETPFAIPLVCAQEVLQGARDEGEWRRLRTALVSQELAFPSDPQRTHLEAARIFFDCRRRGLTVRSSVDCLIAAVALERRDVLLHDDSDFEAIAKVRPLRSLRS